MALDKDKLINEIRKLNDSSFEDFAGWGSSFQFYCNAWAECIKTYASDITPPSTTLEQAKNAMSSFLQSAGNVIGRVFEDSIQIFATELAIGMAPTFTGVVSPMSLILSHVYTVGINGGSAKEVAELMAEIIHSWFLQGTAINVNTGVTINWS